jgi:hypothetical protein
MSTASYFSILATIFLVQALPRWACLLGAFVYTGLSIANMGLFK